MLESFVSYIIILVICLSTGFASSNILHLRAKETGAFFSTLIIGIVTITIWTGFFSIFSKIGLVSNLIIIALDIAYLIIFRERIIPTAKNAYCYINNHKWEMITYAIVAIVIAYFNSRGVFHTDTNLYHAANIRMYEESSVIKGIANLFNNYGYNSMYHAFCAFFSEHWVLNKPWHSTSGFLALIFSAYSIHNIKSLNGRKARLSDAGCVAILIYVLNILYYINSPATDFAAMLFSLYLMTEWLRIIETNDDVHEYANLCVLAVYILTLKMSAGPLIITVIYPLYVLFKAKNYKTIGKYFGICVIVALPYLIRNYYISGWLLYPFSGIDIFDVKWKVPVDILEMDTSIISINGKCILGLPADLPIKEWLPIWWNAQEYYGKLLVLSTALATVMILIHLTYRAIKDNSVFSLVVILLGNYAALILWFLEAPFIRYGLAFILFTSCLGVVVYLYEKRTGFRRLIMGSTAILTIFLMLPFVDHYFGDNLGFASMHKYEPYYISQKDYDIVETSIFRVGNIEINGGNGSINSYYAYPGTIGPYADSRLDALGEKFEDGFYMRK